MRYLRLRTLAALLPVVACFCTTQADGQDWSRGEQGSSRSPFGHAPFRFDSPSDEQRPSGNRFDLPEPAEAYAAGYDQSPGDDQRNGSPDGERPYYGLRPSDAFPINDCDDSLRNLCPDCDKAPTWGLYYFV